MIWQLHNYLLLAHPIKFYTNLGLDGNVDVLVPPDAGAQLRHGRHGGARGPRRRHHAAVVAAVAVPEQLRGRGRGGERGRGRRQVVIGAVQQHPATCTSSCTPSCTSLLLLLEITVVLKQEKVLLQALKQMSQVLVKTTVNEKLRSRSQNSHLKQTKGHSITVKGFLRPHTHWRSATGDLRCTYSIGYICL